MTREKKQEYTLRIANANKTELIILLYEICITYLDDALYNENDIKERNLALSHVRDCLDEMIQNLDYRYEPAKALKQLYTYMKIVVRQAIIENDITNLSIIRDKLDKLRASYEQIKDVDSSGPVMIHTQSVLTGMTYSKNKILDELTQEQTFRGYRV
ncbi:MAG: flagellar protein FliS [Lachnospiraceae bacterium]|nr:flagellar protein FliS [Candidatus Colinaster equi]